MFRQPHRIVDVLVFWQQLDGSPTTMRGLVRMLDETLATALRQIGDAITPEHARATEKLFAPLHTGAPPDDVAVERDIAYGSHDRHRLDTFRAIDGAASPMPVVVFVHGGNFVAGNKSTPSSPFYDNVGIWAAHHNLIGVTVNYRLAPEAQYPSGVEDLSAVVSWLKENIAEAGGDPDRIALIGASAGATHVAGFLADTSQPAVAGAVLMSGRYDLTTLAHDAAIRTYFGADADLAEISPLPRLAEAGIPIMPVIAELDPPDHQEQFLRFVAALTEEQGQLPPLGYLAKHNHFSEVLHLGTEDRCLGDPLEAFVSGLGPGVQRANVHKGEPARPVADGAEHTQRELEGIAEQYRHAYVERDPSTVPISPRVRYTENNVELTFPDGSWDAVTEEVGPALIFSDPHTGGAAVFTAIMMNDTPGFLAIRLKIRGGQITEIEHLLSTKRAVSGPPTPFGDVRQLHHQPVIGETLSPEVRSSREDALAVADGYFQTLSRNDGVLHTKFAATCYRIENGYQAAPQGAAADFLLGRYRFNQRVRREWLMVDEARGICLARGFIDHKGLMREYETTDGSMRESPFQEPHTWSFLEMFKVKNGEIAAVEATFVSSPYFSRSPWATEAEIQDEDPTWNGGAILLKDRRSPEH
ncbi:MAG: alpha/beta hydrolase fold domain-containing protein [Pseudonocardiaceae bacterium]|nr:alpha/beta hydrolase fold domain-containing protein [Pseudonocardiaceae bacterium]